MTQPPKISDSDFVRLQNHVRLLHGLKKHADVPRRKAPTSRPKKSVGPFATTTKSTTTISPCLAAVAAAAGVDLGASASTPRTEDADWPASRPRTNQTYLFRRQCVQKRMHSHRQCDSLDVRETQRMHDVNLRPKQTDYFRLNKAFHMRWKNIRGLPVVHSHFRHTFLDTGKPPFVVPAHYKPFNVYWDADYAKQEFIFLDAATDDKKKDKDKEKEKEETPEPTPPVARKSSSIRRESSTLEQHPSSPQHQRPPRKTSSQISQERRERESTGYEGFPRDSVIEAYERAHGPGQAKYSQ